MILPDDQLLAILEKSNAVPHDLLETVAASVGGEQGTLAKQLIAKHVLTEEQLGEILAKAAGVPFISLSKLTIPKEIFSLVPTRLMLKNKIVAFEKTGDTLKVAMSDPRNKAILDMLAFLLRLTRLAISFSVA